MASEVNPKVDDMNRQRRWNAVRDLSHMEQRLADELEAVRANLHAALLDAFDAGCTRDELSDATGASDRPGKSVVRIDQLLKAERDRREKKK